MEVPEQNLQKYENKLKNLLTQRQKVLQQLKTVRKRMKFYQYNGIDQPRKIIKKDQQISKDNHKSMQIPPETIKEQFLKANQVQASLKQRNKRIFDGLSNHLLKAKNILQSQESKIKKKIQIQEKTLQKEKTQTQKLREERKKRLEEENHVGRQKKQKNAKQILKYQNLILHHKYSNYVNQLQSFIFTRTQPQIAWKPAKQSNLIKKIIDESKGQQQVLHDKVIFAIDSYNQIFDWCKFQAENQQQYSKNKMNSYSGHKSYNIITKTQPNIFWRPISLLQAALRESHQYTKTFLAEERKSIQERKNQVGQKGAQQSDSEGSLRQQDSK